MKALLYSSNTTTTMIGVIIFASCCCFSWLRPVDGALRKLCLFFPPAGHVRTDPILSQTCLSDHVHTFYGPQQFRPETKRIDLLNTPSRFSTTDYEENKSLYWHPTIYQYNPIEETYTKSQISESTAYYRFDDAVQHIPFPSGFKMIAGLDMSDRRAGHFSECLSPEPCTRPDSCESESTFFPHTACGSMNIAMIFPICWDGRLDSPDDQHTSHMAYTHDGRVTGKCPPTHRAGKFPQLQIFVRISNYPGGYHMFSDETDIFHADFMNGWEPGVWENLIANCPAGSPGSDIFNPPCGCTEFLETKPTVGETPCPVNTRRYIANEDVDGPNLSHLPRGTCNGTLVPGNNVPFVEECVQTPRPTSHPCVEGCGGEEGERDNYVFYGVEGLGDVVLEGDDGEFIDEEDGEENEDDEDGNNNDDGEEIEESDSSPPTSGNSSNNNILLLGDSWASFLGADTLEGLCTGTSVRNIAIGGTTAKEWANGLITSSLKSLQGFIPDYAWLSIGGNDILGNLGGNCKPQDDYPSISTNIQRVVQELKTTFPDIQIVITGYGIPSKEVWAEECNSLEIVQELNTLYTRFQFAPAKVIPVYTLFGGSVDGTSYQLSDLTYYEDSIHLNMEGYKRLFSYPTFAQAMGGCNILSDSPADDDDNEEEGDENDNEVEDDEEFIDEEDGEENEDDEDGNSNDDGEEIEESESSPPTSVNSSNNNILLLGDSWASFLGADKLEGLCTGTSVRNIAIGGSTANAWADNGLLTSRLKSLQEFVPDYAWLSIGGNDVGAHLESGKCRPQDDYPSIVANIQRVIQELKTAFPNMQIVITGYGIPSKEIWSEECNSLEIVQELNALYTRFQFAPAKVIPVYTLFGGSVDGTSYQLSDLTYYEDSVHLNMEGYKRLFSYPTFAQAMGGCNTSDSPADADNEEGESNNDDGQGENNDSDEEDDSEEDEGDGIAFDFTFASFWWRRRLLSSLRGGGLSTTN